MDKTVRDKLPDGKRLLGVWAKLYENERVSRKLKEMSPVQYRTHSQSYFFV